MEYTIIANGRSYDLPKKTVAIMGKVDDALKVDALNTSIRDKFDRLHKFAKDVLGEENAAEILGATTLDEIDLSELSLVVLKINDAYDKPLADYRTEKMREKMDSIPTEKIVSLTKGMQSVANAQMMKR